MPDQIVERRAKRAQERRQLEESDHRLVLEFIKIMDERKLSDDACSVCGTTDWTVG